MRIEVPQVRLGLGVPLGRRLADALKRGRVALRRLLEEGRSPIRGRGQPPLCIAGRRARAGGQSRNARHKTEPGDCQRGFRASPRGLPAEADPMISKNTCCHHHPHPRAGGQCTEGALPAAPPIGHIAGRTPMRRAMWPVRPTMYGGQCGLLSTPARPLAPCAVLWEMRPIIFSFHALKITRRPRRVVDGCQPRMAGRMMTHRFPGSRWRAFTAKAQRACRRQGRSSAGGLAHHTGPSRRVWQRVHRTRTQRWLKWGGGGVIAAQWPQPEVMACHTSPTFWTDIKTGGRRELSKFLFAKKHRKLPSLIPIFKRRRPPTAPFPVIGHSLRRDVKRVMRGLLFRAREGRGGESPSDQ